jgi:hypothetical protein
MRRFILYTDMSQLLPRYLKKPGYPQVESAIGSNAECEPLIARQTSMSAAPAIRYLRASTRERLVRLARG